MVKVRLVPHLVLLVVLLGYSCTVRQDSPTVPLPIPSTPTGSTSLPSSSSPPPPPLQQPGLDTNALTGDMAAVTYIVDGDTIEVVIDGASYRVRYIGMDTPERGDHFFDEATDANRQLVEDQTVIMVKDVSETDRYGRLLRYVYLADGTFVNAELVRQGYAQVATFPPDVRHQALFVQLQQEARNAGFGLWSQTATTLTPLPADTAEPENLPLTNCDPAYPTVCIPPKPPDLNCGSIPYKDFPVLEPDPHGFDRDNDGIGCES